MIRITSSIQRLDQLQIFLCLKFAGRKFPVLRYSVLENHLPLQLHFTGSYPPTLMISAFTVHVQHHFKRALLCQDSSAKIFTIAWQNRQQPCCTVVLNAWSQDLNSCVTFIKRAVELGAINEYAVQFSRAASCFEFGGCLASPEVLQRAVISPLSSAEWNVVPVH